VASNQNDFITQVQCRRCGHEWGIEG
jgi:ribosomal protein L37E